MKLKEKLNYNNKYINTNDYKLITTYVEKERERKKKEIIYSKKQTIYGA